MDVKGSPLCYNLTEQTSVLSEVVLYVLALGNTTKGQKGLGFLFNKTANRTICFGSNYSARAEVSASHQSMMLH